MNKYSSRVTQPRSQGASQAMLYGIGLTDADLQKPQVGICSMWYEGNTCNMHLDRLAAQVKEGVQAAGLVGLRFNTIGVSDGLSMGTDGMSYSLPSRDLIADSIETVMGAQWYDALITVPGCDKNMPGSVIAMARLNRPSLMVYGGTIRAGHALGKPRDIISAFQSYGEYLAGVDHRRAAARHRQALVPGRRRLRRDVHRQHDGGGDRGARPVAAVQLVAAGRGPGQGRRVPPCRRGSAHAARARPQAARHPDAASRSRTRW